MTNQSTNQSSDERRLRLAVQTIVPREAHTLPRGIIALPTTSTDVGNRVGCLNLPDVGPVCCVGVVESVVPRGYCREGQPVDLRGAAVAARPPFNFQEMLVTLHLRLLLYMINK